MTNGKFPSGSPIVNGFVRCQGFRNASAEYSMLQKKESKRTTMKFGAARIASLP